MVSFSKLVPLFGFFVIPLISANLQHSSHLEPHSGFAKRSIAGDEKALLAELKTLRAALAPIETNMNKTMASIQAKLVAKSLVADMKKFEAEWIKADAVIKTLIKNSKKTGKSSSATLIAAEKELSAIVCSAVFTVRYVLTSSMIIPSLEKTVSDPTVSAYMHLFTTVGYMEDLLGSSFLVAFTKYLSWYHNTAWKGERTDYPPEFGIRENVPTSLVCTTRATDHASHHNHHGFIKRSIAGDEKSLLAELQTLRSALTPIEQSLNKTMASIQPVAVTNSLVNDVKKWQAEWQKVDLVVKTLIENSKKTGKSSSAAMTAAQEELVAITCSLVYTFRNLLTLSSIFKTVPDSYNQALSPAYLGVYDTMALMQQLLGNNFISGFLNDLEPSWKGDSKRMLRVLDPEKAMKSVRLLAVGLPSFASIPGRR
ncbi:hypothetical protein T439DRAFT_334900 [Meredithblackwellia eburnea MCA 4105]